MSSAPGSSPSAASRARDAFYGLVAAVGKADATGAFAEPAVASRAICAVVLAAALARRRGGGGSTAPASAWAGSEWRVCLETEDPDRTLRGDAGARWLDLRDLDDAAVVAALSALDPAGPLADEDALEIERIGEVYEGIADLRVGITADQSVALRPTDAVVDLVGLVGLPAAQRVAAIERAIAGKLSSRARAAVSGAADIAALEESLRSRLSPRYPSVLPAGRLVAQPSGARRAQGSHFTPRELSRTVVSRALGPLLARGGAPLSARDVLALKICDPAMGAGAFVVEAGEVLARALVEAWRREGQAADLRAARSQVVPCLYGVDRDPLAAALARRVVAAWAGLPPNEIADVSRRLRVGDALVGLTAEEVGEPAGSDLGRRRLAGDAMLAACLSGDRSTRADRTAEVQRLLRAWAGGSLAEPALRAIVAAGDIGDLGPAFHWDVELEEVFARRRGGFDAVVGNPPWVAYAGRAAQPLDPALFDFFVERYQAFYAYRTLHGIFVERSAKLLRRGGRLGLILPTSVSDLAGYEPVRRAHDALCDVDADLPDFGADAFEGVFQPAMALLSTRRAGSSARSESRPADATWRVCRSDLDAVATSLLERLTRLSPLPAESFGERGFQTTKDDTRHLVERIDDGDDDGRVAIREGSDVAEFEARRPRRALDPRSVTGRFRSPEAWRAVDVLIRQTARYPIAARSDGVAFRNSLLAGFSSELLDPFALVAYLNSSLVRWHHYMRYRDARQGMPQVKVAHLRSIPAPPTGIVGTLAEWGRRLSERNRGIEPAERAELDEVVYGGFDLPAAARRAVRAWSAALPR